MKRKAVALDAATYHTKRGKASPSEPLSKTPKAARTGKRKLAPFCADKHFWPNVDTSTGPDACHNWTGTIDQGNGYGRLWRVEGLPYAHRVSWEVAHGRPVPAGMNVLHLCIGNTLCTNPGHLYLGDQKDNAADCTRQKRRRKALPNAEVMAIVNMRFPNFPLLVKGTKSYTAIAKEFGVGNQCVAHICQGRRRSKLTGIVPGVKIAAPRQAGTKDRRQLDLLEAVS